MTARDAFLMELGCEHREACDRCGAATAAVLCQECEDDDKHPEEER